MTMIRGSLLDVAIYVLPATCKMLHVINILKDLSSHPLAFIPAIYVND